MINLQFTRLILTLFSFVFFTGCTYTTYDYITPNTKEAFQCVYNCDINKEQCNKKKKALQSKLDTKYYYEREQYLNCKLRQDPKHIKKRCQKYIFKCMKHNNKKVCQEQCYRQNKPKKCYLPRREYVIGFNCDSDYNRCFKDCGGEIVPIKKELF